MIINEGGVFINSSGANAGSGIELSGIGSQIRINNGGRYIHNTIRAHAAAIVAKLSTASGTENGIFEFDVPGTSNYPLSLTGRTYGTMVLNSSQSRTYTGSGSSSLSVMGSLIIGNNVTFSPDLAGLIEIDNNLVIEEDASIELSNRATVSVHGTLTNNAGPSGLVIKSDATGTGSLIHNTPGVEATVERYIPESRGTSWEKYDFPTEWFFISSPVINQSITGFLGKYTEAETAYDLYRWEESTDTWLNVQDNNFVHSNFETGTGYLFASPEAKTPEFAGIMFTGDASWNNLSRSGDANPDPGKSDEYYDAGWQLLGNPYTSGIERNGWTTTGFVATPKIWLDGGYVDVGDNQFIPSMTGFMMQVNTESDGNNTLIIPASAQAHSGTLPTPPETKSEPAAAQKIRLITKAPESSVQQQSVILLQPEADQRFDPRFDSRFLQGHAPELYSLKVGERLSTQAVSNIHPDLIIPFAFIKNNEGPEFKIELSESIPGTTPYLYDRKERVEHRLAYDNPYLFTAEEGDDPLRFELRFAALGTEPTSIPEPETPQARIFAIQQTLTIEQYDSPGDRTLEIFDLSGRQLLIQHLDASPRHQQQLNLNPGIYMVRLSNRQTVQTEKIIITQ